MDVVTPDLCDQNPEVQVWEAQFLNFGQKNSFMGEVVTVSCYEDNSRVREIVQTPGKGKVLVVDGKASLRRALLGDRLAEFAVKNGWEGIVINGAIRDVDEINQMNLSVKALATCPRKTDKRGLGDVDVELNVGGLSILPGHYVYADNNGVIVSEKKL